MRMSMQKGSVVVLVTALVMWSVSQVILEATVQCGFAPPGDHQWCATGTCRTVGAQCTVWMFAYGNQGFSHSPCVANYWQTQGCDQGEVITTVQLWRGTCYCKGACDSCCDDLDIWSSAPMSTFASWVDSTGCYF